MGLSLNSKPTAPDQVPSPHMSGRRSARRLDTSDEGPCIAVAHRFQAVDEALFVDELEDFLEKSSAKARHVAEVGQLLTQSEGYW